MCTHLTPPTTSPPPTLKTHLVLALDEHAVPELAGLVAQVEVSLHQVLHELVHILVGHHKLVLGGGGGGGQDLQSTHKRSEQGVRALGTTNLYLGAEEEAGST